MATKPDAIGLFIEKGLEGINRFYSIYRATVIDTNDPDKANGLKVWVPEVLGGIQVWAYPRGQYGSDQCGIKPLTPQEGDTVYVTFEYGDASKPLWEPHGWARGEAPYPLNEPFVGGFITPKGNRILYREDEESLEITFNGQIFLSGGGEVIISSSKAIQIKGDSGVIINEGDNEGLVNITELTQKLNQLVQELETIKTQINTHVHTGNMGNPTTPPVTPISQTISPFNASDYEDIKALH